MGTIRGARTSRAGAALLCAALALGASGCGGDDAEEASDAGSPADSASPSESTADPSPDDPGDETSPAEPEQTVIPITVRGDSVDPRGERVEVAAGEPFVLAIRSDGEGELHVHATPEVDVAFGPGRTREELTIDRPGIVEVELHEPTEVTVVQLEVR